jgi:formylglycine-generating enzyme required for sulfatase activity
MLQLRADPVQRTFLIHNTLPTWHGDQARLAAVVDASIDAPLRSGVCLGIGQIAVEDLRGRGAGGMASGSVEVVRGGCRSWDAQRGRLDLASMAGSVARDPGFGEPVNGRQWYVNSVGMTMLRIPEGSFIRIDLDQPDAKPQEVTLTRPFYLSDREVSVGLFQQFVDDADYEHEKADTVGGADASVSPTPDHPVQGVSWYDAVKFCNWLSRREGRMPCYELKAGATQETGTGHQTRTGNSSRLPTDIGCRPRPSGSTRAERGVKRIIRLVTTYRCWASTAFSVRKADKREVGSRLPNAWGLFDMHGNVWEWCDDWYLPQRATP